jgi:integrase
MAVSTLPRGIQLVQWKNQDKSKSVKYRVRIIRKDFNADKLFDDLNEAKEFLFNSKTQNGIKSIEIAREEAIARESAKLIKEYFDKRTISHYVKVYIENYVDTVFIDTPMRKKVLHSIRSGLKTFCNTEIVIDKDLLNQKGEYGFTAQFDIKMGDLNILEITPIHLDKYVTKRLNTERQGTGTTIKKSTVITEISLVKQFFTMLKKIDYDKFNNFDFERVFNNIDRKPLKNSRNKREFVIKGDDEKNLLSAITKYSNPELRQIILLSLYTGMRNSEVLTIKFNQIKLEQNHIALIHTKSGKPRKVFLTQQARDLINEFDIKDSNSNENVFKYSLNGFEGAFRHFRKIHNLQHIRTHDFRRTLITTILKKIGQENSVLVSEILGIANIQNMLNEYSTSEVSLDTQKDLQNSVGHSKDSTTKIYTNF